jgi:hypothetical protein
MPKARWAARAQTINMNRGINFEVADPADERKRLFLAVPWAVAFKNHADVGYAVSLSSNVVVKVSLDADGTPTINAPKTPTTRLDRAHPGGPGPARHRRELVGQARLRRQRELARRLGDRSRSEKVIATIATAPLPQPGTDAARRLIGKAVFDSSTGIDLDPLSSPGLSGIVQKVPPRLSKEGWSSCFACHGFGRTDNVVWMLRERAAPHVVAARELQPEGPERHQAAEPLRAEQRGAGLPEQHPRRLGSAWA